MQAYSLDLRERIFQARQDGLATAEVAEQFQVSTAFVRRLLQRHRESGTLSPTAQRHGPLPTLGTDQQERLRQAITETPDARPAELRDRLRLNVTPWTVWRTLRRMGLTFKKKRSRPKSGTGPTCKRPAPPGRI